MNNPELQRIRSDLARARQRAAEIRDGKRGVRSPEAWRAGDDAEGGTMPGHGRAFENQLKAQEQAIERLEMELVQAMLPVWSARRVLEAMEPPPVAVTHDA